MDTPRRGWLVGADGLYAESPAGWTRLGNGGFVVTAILPRAEGLVVGAEGGLWYLPAGSGCWEQWHDETMTNVLALTCAPGRPGVLVGSAYGVATAEIDPSGAPRWAWHSDALTVNRRYVNALQRLAPDGNRWLVGTEDGILIFDQTGLTWLDTSLSRGAVRALRQAGGKLWAGTDQDGVWTSTDGESWVRAGRGLEDTPVFALSWAGDRMLAGTDRGVAAGDGQGEWVLSGAPLRVVAVGAMADRWLAGASPGGLWWSDDHGGTWHQDRTFHSVRALAAPEVA